jgi:hypothetical protein
VKKVRFLSSLSRFRRRRTDVDLIGSIVLADLGVRQASAKMPLAVL